MIDAIKRIYGTDRMVENVAGNMCGRSRYTIEDKRRALAIFDRTKSYGEVEKELGVSRNTVRAWKERFGHAGALKGIEDVYNNNLPQNKKSKVKASSRRNNLVNLVKSVAIGTPELAELLAVTIVTVRYDINTLLAAGRIVNISNHKGCYLVRAA